MESALEDEMHSPPSLVPRPAPLSVARSFRVTENGEGLGTSSPALQGCSGSTLQSQHAACPGSRGAGPADMRCRPGHWRWSRSRPEGR